MTENIFPSAGRKYDARISQVAYEHSLFTTQKIYIRIYTVMRSHTKLLKGYWKNYFLLIHLVGSNFHTEGWETPHKCSIWQFQASYKLFVHCSSSSVTWCTFHMADVNSVEWQQRLVHHQPVNRLFCMYHCSMWNQSKPEELQYHLVYFPAGIEASRKVIYRTQC